MRFHDITIGIGNRLSTRVHESDRLVAEAVALFARLIADEPAPAPRAIPVDGLEHITLRWTRVGTGAMATFYARGDLATPFEPGFDATAATERPLIATVVWPKPNVPRADLGMIADMETCLAAAFFLSTIGGA